MAPRITHAREVLGEVYVGLPLLGDAENMGQANTLNGRLEQSAEILAYSYSDSGA